MSKKGQPMEMPMWLVLTWVAVTVIGVWQTMKSPFIRMGAETGEHLQALAVKRGAQMEAARQVGIQLLQDCRDADEAEKILLVMRALSEEPKAA